MIVISKHLTLTPRPVVDLSKPIIGWHNVITLAGLEADSEASGFPVTNIANPSTVLMWRSETTQEQFITIEPGNDPVDYIGLARHNFGSGQIAVEFQGRRGEDGAWNPILPEFIPGDDKPIIARFEPTTFFEVRIRLRPQLVPPFLAVLYLGNLLVMTTGEQPGFTPITLGRQSEVVNARAQSGDYLGAVITQERRSAASQFVYLEYDWFLEHVDPFLKVIRSTPFFYAWAPKSFPDQVGFAWATADVRPTLDAPLYVNLQLSYDAVVA